jgi:hypothetical protein
MARPNKGDFTETRVLPQIRCHDHLAPADCSRTEGHLARALVEVRWQTVLGLEPQPIIVHEADKGDWTLAGFRGQFPSFKKETCLTSRASSQRGDGSSFRQASIELSLPFGSGMRR